jgi:hypothetical protein
MKFSQFAPTEQYVHVEILISLDFGRYTTYIKVRNIKVKNKI